MTIISQPRQVLMRLDSDDDFEPHVDDHGQLMDVLRQMQLSPKEGQASLKKAPRITTCEAAVLKHFVEKDVAR
jgi:hypothetical protein